MSSKIIICVAFLAAVISVILSHPQGREPADQVPQENYAQLADRIPNLQSRTFGSLFNLSAYLQNAPPNGSALNFVPLITVLSALG